MATRTHYLTGIANWARLDKIDNYGKFSISLGLDATELEKFASFGLKSKPKEADGRHWVSLRRDPESTVWNDGAKSKAGKPAVMDINNEPLTALVGNGSEVTVKVVVYDYDNNFGKGKGCRLDAVRVTKLVEYHADKPEDVKDDFHPF